MSNTMELSERLIQVKSIAKHEDFPSFTQDDIVFLFGNVNACPLGSPMPQQPFKVDGILPW